MIWDTAVFQIVVLFDAIMLGAVLSVTLVQKSNKEDK